MPRVLVVRTGAMGDVLHGMPAVAALRATLPEAHIGWAVEPHWADLLSVDSESVPPKADRPLVHNVHLVGTKAWSKRPFSLTTLRSIRTLRHALRMERYDIAIDLQGTIRSAVIARMSGAACVLGPAQPKEAVARLFYTERVTTRAPHVVEQAAEIVSSAAGLNLVPTAVALPVHEGAERWCDALLHNPTGPLVFIAPSAGWGAKQWPADSFGELAAQLSQTGCRVFVNASPDSTDSLADQVIATSGNTAERVACTLPQLIALMRRVNLAIVGDSGPLHLAAALRVPVVALFGPTDPLRNGPYGTRSIVLRHPSSTTTYSHSQQTDTGMLKITVEEVLQAALSLLPTEDISRDTD